MLKLTKRWARRGAVVSVLCALGAAPGFAQTIRGTITGTLTDQSGAVLPELTVTVTHAATNISTRAKTNQEGVYTIPLLASGEYNVTVEETGFKKYVRSGIVIQIAQTTRVNIPLQLGAKTEEVLVVGESPLVRSTTSELGHVVEMKQIQALPLNGRLFSQLISLTPGAISRGFADFAENPAAAGARSAIHHSVNGMPWSGNNYLLDGVANNEPLNAFINISPPLEAIQEFKVQTNNPTAEFGVFGGAAVNLSIRSGTNEFHGSVFEYFRDASLNARTFFAPTKVPFKSHQFGGTFGGPMIRNKAFFFGDYQGLRQDQGRTQTLTVPTQLMREGNLSELGGAIFDPLTGQQFAGNILPAGRINPITRKVADLWPLPNRSGLTNNYIENNVVVQSQNAFDVRLDYKLSDAGSVFVRYSLAKREFDEPAPGNIFMGANNSNSTNYNGVLGYTRTFGSNKFYELRVGYNKYDLAQQGEDFGIDKNNELGIPNGNIPEHPNTSGFASFRPSGFHNTGSPGFTNSVRIGSTLHLTNNFAWIRQNHSFKFGADLRRFTSTLTNPQTMPRGIFDFDRNYTSNPANRQQGHSWASFLLGYPNRVRRDFVNTYPEVRRNFLGLFVQDDIRISRKLTAQVGLRWDLMTPVVDAKNRQSNFSLDDGVIHVASADNRGPNLDMHYDYVAPRVGVAYTPDDGKTAFRAAFGISYFPDNFGANGGTNERNYPFFQENDLVTPNQFVPFRSVSDGLPGFNPVTLAPTLTPPPGFAVFYIPRHFKEDTTKMWNLGVQRELGWNTMVEVNYVGTRGTNIFRSRNINVPDPGPGPVQQRRPYFTLAPTLAAINERDGDGKSWYDGLQVKVDKRFSGGFQALLSYTLSRTEDTAFIQHPSLDELRSRARDKAVDIPHNFVLSFTYEVPFKAESSLLRTLLEGWSINAITTYQSGDPLNLGVSASQLNTGTGNWPDVTCSEINHPKTVQQWFDKSCFADPARTPETRYNFGNYKIGDARGPEIFNTDLSLFKKSSIGKTTLELRVEAFNVFNKAHFSNPGTTFGTGQFGVVSGTRLPSREIQLGARFLF